jgi:hypothetical protein
MAEADFLLRLQVEESLTFTVWSRTRDNMYCLFRRLPLGWVESYTVGSAVRDEAEVFVGRLLERFIEETAAGERMLVVDWAAEATDRHLDDLWTGRRAYSGPMPDVVGLPDRLRSGFQPAQAAISLPAPHGYSVLARRPLA